ncbi:hypothetical protein [Bosea sp. (in: a-proteobacteria)]|jgi:hypothetical protein|uniref:hypothetical protein n=1 Tax=Bosea sp. (in: a-proteobacteria) TaxID=1871050 RepID=UPI0035617A26
MTLSLREELRRTFALAALRQEASHLTTPRHWAQANGIQQKAQRLRGHERDDFRNRYDTRVEVAQRRLMHKAGALDSRDLTPDGAGTDSFSPDALLRQAQREVRMAHERRLMWIGEIERRMLTGVVKNAERENAIQGQACEAFNRSAQLPQARKQNGPSHT